MKSFILRACAVSRLTLTGTRTCNGIRHPIISFIECHLATKHTKDFTLGSTISLGPVFHVSKQAKGRKKRSKYDIQYQTIFFSEAF